MLRFKSTPFSHFWCCSVHINYNSVNYVDTFLMFKNRNTLFVSHYKLWYGCGMYYLE